MCFVLRSRSHVQAETLAEQAAWNAVKQGAWDAETPLLSQSLSSISSLDVRGPSVHDDSMNQKVSRLSKSPTYEFLVRSSVKRASAPRGEEDETAVELSSSNKYRAQKKPRNKLRVVFPSQPV